MDNQTKIQILTRAKWLLLGGWYQWWYACTSTPIYEDKIFGFASTHWNDPRAWAFCLVGAIYKAGWELKQLPEFVAESEDYNIKAQQYFLNEIAADLHQFALAQGCLNSLNDRATTIDEILIPIEKTIKGLRSPVTGAK